jgi:hypothetical protein
LLSANCFNQNILLNLNKVFNSEIFLFLLSVLGFELRASHLPSRHLSHSAGPFSIYSYFSGRVLVF